MSETQTPVESNVVEQWMLGLLSRPFARPNIVAVTVGVLSYALLWWLHIGGLKTILDWWFHPSIPAEVQAWFRDSAFWPIYAYAECIVPGLLAGLIASRKGLMHGLIVGTSTPFVNLAFGMASGTIGPLYQEVGFPRFNRLRP